MPTDPRLKNLVSVVSDTYSKQAIEGAQHALNDTNNPLRASFFATAMRILIERALHSQAPDNEVKNCSWFIPNKDTNGKPTRNQRAMFCIHGGIPEKFLEEISSLYFKNIKYNVIKSIDNMNKLLHQPNIDYYFKNFNNKHISEITDSIYRFFHSIIIYRSNLSNYLVERIVKEFDFFIEIRKNEIYDTTKYEHVDQTIYPPSTSIIKSTHIEYHMDGFIEIQNTKNKIEEEIEFIDISILMKCPVEDPFGDIYPAEFLIEKKSKNP
ncbi:hypothetical protein [Thalassospira sp.]|uniref:pPIWI-associating nuclease domain-containing protein n=1 Tax=Thalassospira sp. TaxID=1912094 RepID=UPI002736CD5E|nr:hypothetical protein [Thalassospira sp.]MDP2700152.1 hypothetical protein [Thalassospira sp.]